MNTNAQAELARNISHEMNATEWYFRLCPYPIIFYIKPMGVMVPRRPSHLRRVAQAEDALTIKAANRPMATARVKRVFIITGFDG